MPFSDVEVADTVRAIHQADNVDSRNFRVAALLSQLFRELGTDPVVVGGPAVEFYTAGGYVSGDIDLCFAGAVLPTPVQCAAVMSRVGARALGIRKFVFADVYVDLLGAVVTGARTAFGQIGPVKLIAIEDLVAERVFAATAYPGSGPEQEAVAKVLLAAVISGQVAAEHGEIQRLAASSDYGSGSATRPLVEGSCRRADEPGGSSLNLDGRTKDRRVKLHLMDQSPAPTAPPFTKGYLPRVATVEEWQAGRAAHRLVCMMVNGPDPIRRKAGDPRKDAVLRQLNGGERGARFATVEELRRP